MTQLHTNARYDRRLSTLLSMKTLSVCITLIALAHAAASAQASALAGDTLRTLALRATALESRRQLATATPATIDSLLSMYTDSVVYEHPNAGAVLRGKSVMRRNMSQFIGSVRAVNAQFPRVTIGARVAIVETNATMEINDGGKWLPVTRHGIRIIEFDDRGLVRRIIDYPW